MSRGVLFEVVFGPETEAYVTHYLVVRLGDHDIAIGEAAEVVSLGPARWRALVAQWGRNPVTGEIDSRIFAKVGEMDICGPGFRLVPKEIFRVSCPS